MLSLVGLVPMSGEDRVQRSLTLVHSGLAGLRGCCRRLKILSWYADEVVG